jgi:Rod binding domain-containing protein
VTPVTGTPAPTMAMAGPPSQFVHSIDPSSPTSPEALKLRQAAGQFESILLESLWKSMKETFAEPEEESDPTLKGFDDWGIQAMASAVGNSGGLGIKNLILKYLEPKLPEAGSVTTGRQ